MTMIIVTVAKRAIKPGPELAVALEIFNMKTPYSAILTGTNSSEKRSDSADATLRLQVQTAFFIYATPEPWVQVLQALIPAVPKNHWY
jgi:hypothetical protein